eukprot:COSAG04_NODE_283_length_18154_cov_432.957020_9_plen_250_part_00
MPEYKSFRGPVSPEATLRWAFDLDGYTVLRQAAAFDTHPTEAEALALAERPPEAVAACIALVCGSSADIHGQASTGPEWDGWDGQHETMPIDYVLDSPPVLLGGAGGLGSGGGWLTETADLLEMQRLEYNTADRPPNDDHVASVLGLRLIYCTPPKTGARAISRRVVVAPASHKGLLPPPTPAKAVAMGAVEEVELMPGDCLLAAATTLVALPPDEPHQEPENGRSAALLQLILAEVTAVESSCACPSR